MSTSRAKDNGLFPAQDATGTCSHTQQIAAVQVLSKSVLVVAIAKCASCCWCKEYQMQAAVQVPSLLSASSTDMTAVDWQANFEANT